MNAAPPDPGDPGYQGYGYIPTGDCSDLHQNFEIANNGAAVTKTYYVLGGSGSPISNCRFGSNITVQPRTYPSVRTTCSSAFDLTIMADSMAQPGWRSMTCSYGSEGDISSYTSQMLFVYDATPAITSINPDTILAGSVGVPVTITGTNFGNNPSRDPSWILISPANSGLTVCSSCITSWTPEQIVVQMSAADNQISDYDVDVSIASHGANGLGFQTSTNQPNTPLSSSRRVTVRRRLTISGKVILSTNNSAMSGVSISLKLNDNLIELRQTGSDGRYSFTADAGGSYTVTPSNLGYYFDPQAVLFNNVADSKIADFTATPIRTVYLIHGIGQRSAAMNTLYLRLTNPATGIDLSRAQVDAGFDFADCAQVHSCSTTCSVGSGGSRLAQYILSTQPPGDVVLVGYSNGRVNRP